MSVKTWSIISGVVLVAMFGYLPFELAECDRMVAEYGENFFCIPITFVTIPALVTLLIFLLATLAWRRARQR